MEEMIVENLIEINRNLEKLIKVLENKTPVARTTDDKLTENQLKQISEYLGKNY